MLRTPTARVLDETDEDAVHRLLATDPVAPQGYRVGAVFSSTRIMCNVVVPIFSAAWVNGSR